MRVSLLGSYATVKPPFKPSCFTSSDLGSSGDLKLGVSVSGGVSGEIVRCRASGVGETSLLGPACAAEPMDPVRDSIRVVRPSVLGFTLLLFGLRSDLGVIIAKIEEREFAGYFGGETIGVMGLCGEREGLFCLSRGVPYDLDGLGFTSESILR